MYHKLQELQHIRFSNCNDCQQSCCDGSRFIMAPLVLDDMAQVYKNFPIAFARIEHELKLVMLISNRTKPCRYFEAGVCTIYESRPPACKLYPVTPYYSDILIDATCPALGAEGDALMEEDRVTAKFYDKRLEGFEQKLEATQRFLANLDWSFRPIYEIDGIALLEYAGGQQNSFIQMHKASLKQLAYFS